MPTNVIVTNDGTVATLTLSSEDGLHILSRATLSALRAHLDALTRDADLRGLILTGQGTRAFSAGADLRELAELDQMTACQYAAFGQSITQALADFPAPTIAALNGPAYGGGIEMALACDFRLAAPKGLMHYQAAKLGLLPGWGGTQRLPALVGPARAKAMMVMCRPVAPALALDWGLVDEASDSADLEPLLARWRADLTELDGLAAVQIKRAIALSASGNFAGEQEAFAACFADGRARAKLGAWLGRSKAPTP